MLKSLIPSLSRLGKKAQPDLPVLTLDVSRVMKHLTPKATPSDAAQAADEPLELKDRVKLANLAEEAVGSLTGQFDTWMKADLDRLVEAWRAAREPGATPEQYRSVFVAAHNIRGVANSYGYPAIARLCSSLSDLLSDTKPGENSALINLHVEACRAAFHSIGQSGGASTVADAVCDALEQRVAAKRANP